MATSIEATPITTNPALLDAVKTLAMARALHAISKAEASSRIAAFDAANADCLATLKRDAQKEDEAERVVRALAVSEYEATGEQKPCDGVTIVLSKVLGYDKKEAAEWAIVAMPALITPPQLDVKAFDKIARAVTLPFVTITETPAVRIASMLEV